MRLVARDGDLARAIELAAVPGIVSLVGRPGVGTSSLAAALVAASAPDFAVIRTCQLEVLADESLIEAVVADVVGATTELGIEPVDALVSAFLGRRALLVLDHVGQIVGAAGRLALRLVEACPLLTIVVTTTQRLQVVGESVLSIEPLASPEAAYAVARRAQAVGPVPDDFAELWDVIGGLPRALQMVGARAEQRSWAEAARDIGERVQNQGGRRRDVLAVVVDWSYELLSDEARFVCDRLSVFESGWVIGGAMAVAGPRLEDDIASLGGLDENSADPLTRSGVADQHVERVTELLDELERAALVLRMPGASGVRWVMPEALRHHGQRRLAEQGERTAVRDAHLAHVTAEARIAHGVCRGRELEAGVARFDIEWDNFRAAMDWAIAAQRVSAVDELFRVLDIAMWWLPRREVVLWGRRAASRAEATGAGIGASTRRCLAIGEAAAGDHERALRANLLAIDTAQSSEDRSWARHFAAAASVELGRLSDAAGLLDAMIAEPPSSDMDAAVQLAAHAALKFTTGRLDERATMQTLDRARALATSSKSSLARAHVLRYCSDVEAALGHQDRAEALLADAVAESRRDGVEAFEAEAVRWQVGVSGVVGLSGAVSAMASWGDAPALRSESFVLEALGINLVELGFAEDGALLLGHLQSDPVRRASTEHRRPRAEDECARSRRAPVRWATGRETSRDDVIDFARSAAVAAMSASGRLAR